MLLTKQFVIGPVKVNCNVLYSAETRECVLVDPGGYPKEMKSLLSWIRKAKLSIKYILITHAHLDHIMGIVPVIKLFPDIPVYLHDEDTFLYNAIESQTKMFGVSIKKSFLELPVASPITHKQILGNDVQDKSLQCKVFHTPGHSPGSCCFYFETEDLLFSGDTLFRFNIGRTDLVGGNFNEILNSIRSSLYSLSESTIVIPGHGDRTTIKEEKEHNLFTQTNEGNADSIKTFPASAQQSQPSHPCPLCSPHYLSSSL